MDTDDNSGPHTQLQINSNTQTSTNAHTEPSTRNNQQQSYMDTSPARKTKAEEDGKPKIAPIIITDTTKWIQISKLIKYKRIATTSAN